MRECRAEGCPRLAADGCNYCHQHDEDVIFTAPHGGYPGEVVVQDEYLLCPQCGSSFPLDQGDVECEDCETELVVDRGNPPPEATLSMFWSAPTLRELMSRG